jgi:hypothetical protein
MIRRFARSPNLAYERDFGRVETKSVLVGAIWQVRDNLAADLGLRGGWIRNHSVPTSVLA